MFCEAEGLPISDDNCLEAAITIEEAVIENRYASLAGGNKGSVQVNNRVIHAYVPRKRAGMFELAEWPGRSLPQPHNGDGCSACFFRMSLRNTTRRGTLRLSKIATTAVRVPH